MGEKIVLKRVDARSGYPFRNHGSFFVIDVRDPKMLPKNKSITHKASLDRETTL